MSYLVLIAGVVTLLVCGDLLVRGAVGLAERLAIPPVIIGLTIVAFGTSAPELVVSLKAALTGSPGIALGNVIGSNIANILLVLGLPALVVATQCDQPHIMRNAAYMLIVSLVFIILCQMGPLGIWHGAVLLTLMGLFLADSARHTLKERNGVNPVTLEEIENIGGVALVPHKMSLTLMFVAGGLIGLPVGGHLVVEAARTIAVSWGVSEAVIGLTIVAVGTSLPELATTLIAAMRNHCGLAIGNVLGSNIFNILAIMGVTAVITPVAVDERFLRFDLWVMLAVALMVLPFILRRRDLTRIPGAIFVCVYLVYVYMLVDNQVTAAVAGF